MRKKWVSRLIAGLGVSILGMASASAHDALAAEYCVPAGPRVALTFDDGPWYNFTPELLSILNEKQVLGTFFVVGQRVRANPETLQLVYEAGHEIGLHTDSHQSLVTLTPTAQNAQIQRNYDAVRAVLPGMPIRYWRAPYGAVPKNLPSVVVDLGLKHQGWSVDTQDWRKPTEEIFLSNALGRVHDRAVILMHEHTYDTRTFLPVLIDKLREKGYQFVVLSDLKAPTCPENVLVVKPDKEPVENSI